MYDDQTLTCRDCGVSFTFTSGEQAFYASKGFDNGPSRCPDCRRANGRGGSGYAGGSEHGDYGGGTEHPEELFSTVCAQCGEATRVSARLLLGDDPVYCPTCIALQPAPPPGSSGGWRESW